MTTTVRHTFTLGRSRRLAVISGFDSQFKWGSAVAHKFAKRGYEVDFFAPTVRKNQISARQLGELRIPFPIHYLPKQELFGTTRLFDYDVVLFSLPAGLTEQGLLTLTNTCLQLAAAPTLAHFERRPILLAGFVGINYENRIGSVVSRRHADIIMANAPDEQRFFQGVAERFGFSHPKIVLSGLALLDSRRPFSAHVAEKPRKRVLFAAQPTVPRTLPERVYLLTKLRELAIRFPHYDVVIKPRHQIGEATFHDEKHHLEELLYTYFVPEDLPRNLTVDYTPISTQLETSDLCLTVSSTAAVEALAYGVPFGVLTDFAVTEPYGAEFFGGSGALISFEELFAGRFPAVDEGWVRDNVGFAADHFDNVFVAVDELIARQEREGAMLPVPSTPYDRARRASIDFIDGWRAARNTERYVREITSGPFFDVKFSWVRRSGSPSVFGVTYRKARKLLRDPKSFVADSRIAKILVGATPADD